MELNIPDKLAFFVKKNSRYKIAYGGRGAGKSWTIADCLLVRAIKTPCRILCTRELQNSIRDSVYRLLVDRIKFHKLDAIFEITDSEIRCKNGTLFIFKGLRSNMDEIKSLEGVNICWVEEAQKVSNKSWDLLVPTIRTKDSEIWVSFNTGSEKDPVYERFVDTVRGDTLITKVNYYDNPWFPDVLRREMEWDKLENPERYKNVWLGEPGYEGQFFVEFSEALEERPFNMEISQMEGKVFGSLDSGTTHATSFGLWFIDTETNTSFPILHRLFTYLANGGTIREHATEIFNRIEAFPWTVGFFPEKIFADPSMWTKVKLNEYMVRAPIDEYIEMFHGKHKVTRFEKANNDKVNGCQIMRMMFKGMDNVPQIRYFKEYNKSFPDGITRVVVDENNPEIYGKQEGDDVADEARYGMVAGFSMAATLRQRQRHKQPKTHMEKVLAGHYSKKAQGDDWYNS